MRIQIKPRVLIGALLAIFVLLFLGNAAALYLLVGRGLENALGFVPLFHFDRESNLPTLFSGAQLAIAGLLALLIARRRRLHGEKWHRHWLVVAVVLFFLCVDDMAHLHEKIDIVLMSRMKTSGLIHWPWVIPYGLVAVAVAAFFVPFFFGLPMRLRIAFASAAAMYLGGALGLEMLAARHAEHAGEATVHYAVLMTIEESLEMLAVTLVIGALLRHAVSEAGGLETTIRVGDGEPGEKIDGRPG